MLYGFSPSVFLQKSFCLLLIGVAAASSADDRAHALALDFRLACNLGGTCDAGDFLVDHPEAVADLEFVEQFYAPFSDSLSALTGASVSFTHPDTGAVGFGLSNFSVPADTLVIYVGGRDLSGNQVGAGGPGNPGAAFARGQGTITGLTATDFASWGGVIAFDTTNSNGTPRSWHFGSSSEPGPGQVDFISVALHELGHVLGIGTSDSLENQVTGGLLQGTTATSVYGAGVPMQFEAAMNRHVHWGDDVTSPPYAHEPNPLLADSVRLGRRTLLSPLDYAGLADVGWEVPPQLLGLHGNADGDNDVDGLDFLAWQRGYGMSTSGSALAGDLNGQGAVDSFDLWLWQRYYGATSAPRGFFANQVPEPATLCLLAAGALVIFRRELRARTNSR